MDPGATIVITGIAAFTVMVVAMYGSAAYCNHTQAVLVREDMRRRGYICSKCKAKETQ